MAKSMLLNIKPQNAPLKALATQPTCTWHPHPKNRIDTTLTLVHYERTRTRYRTQDISGGGSREDCSMLQMELVGAFRL